MAAVAGPLAAAWVLARAPVGRGEDSSSPYRGMGQRRVPARPSHRCRRGRTSRRAILPLLGRCRLLRRLACGGAARPVHACCRGDPPAGPIDSRRGDRNRARLSPRAVGVLSQVAATMGAISGVVSAGAWAASRSASRSAGGSARGRLEYRWPPGRYQAAQPLRTLVFAHGTPGRRTVACASRSMPESFTTSASALTSATCCGVLARIDQETEYVLLCQRAGSLAGADARPEFPRGAGQRRPYSVREQFTCRWRCAASGSTSSTRRTTCCRR